MSQLKKYELHLQLLRKGKSHIEKSGKLDLKSKYFLKIKNVKTFVDELAEKKYELQLQLKKGQVTEKKSGKLDLTLTFQI